MLALGRARIRLRRSCLWMIFREVAESQTFFVLCLSFWWKINLLFAKSIYELTNHKSSLNVSVICSEIFLNFSIIQVEYTSYESWSHWCLSGGPVNGWDVLPFYPLFLHHCWVWKWLLYLELLILSSVFVYRVKTVCIHYVTHHAIKPVENNRSIFLDFIKTNRKYHRASPLKSWLGGSRHLLDSEVFYLWLW